MAMVAPSPQDVGRALQSARERNHVELQDAAAATRIPKRYLEALESNAPLDTFPAPVYARAFLREYARYLGLDPEPLVDALAPAEPPPLHTGALREALPPPRRWPTRVVLGISICTLVGLAVVGILSGRTTLPPASATSADHTPPAHPARSTAPPAPAPTRGVRAALHVVDRTWVEAIADGVVLYRGIWDSNWHVLRAKHRLDLTLGNAGGTRLLVNGRRVHAGGPGEVAHLSLAFAHGSVHVTRA